MTKRSKTAKSARNKISSLAKKVPEKQTFLYNLVTFQVPDEDKTHVNERTVAIIGGSYVEYGLRQALIAALPKDSVDPELAYLFEGDAGILNTFGAKIKMAKALGILNKTMHAEVDLIRRIRNVFAHSMDTVSFFDMQELCNELRCVYPGRGNRPDATYADKISDAVLGTPMYKFVQSADLCHSWLVGWRA